MPDLKGAAITWLGHATVLIQTPKGTTILIDPFIEHNPKFPKGYKLPDKIDLLLLTHGHMDHIADAVPVAKKHGPAVIGMVELIGWLQSKGLSQDRAIGMNIGGNPAGFVIVIDNGPVLYHAGDTGLFSDMQLIRELHHPQIAMLPIGDHYTMGPKAAAVAAMFLGAKTILPIHFGTFPALTGTPAALEKELADTDVEVIRTDPGKTLR